jgi:hypothetical protein
LAGSCRWSPDILCTEIRVADVAVEKSGGFYPRSKTC